MICAVKRMSPVHGFLVCDGSLFLKIGPYFLSKRVFWYLRVCNIFYKTIIIYINKIYCLISGWP